MNYFTPKKIITAFILLAIIASWNFLLFCYFSPPSIGTPIEDQAKLSCYSKLTDEFGSISDPIGFIVGYPLIFGFWLGIPPIVTIPLNFLLFLTISNFLFFILGKIRKFFIKEQGL